jgi:hypothetical protein
MFDKREPERTELAADLAALEQQLAALTPTAPRIDRDKLMFAAGQAAVSRPRWPGDVFSRPKWPGYIGGPCWAGSSFWPAATAMMTAATVLLATMLVWQRQSAQVAEREAKPQAALARVDDRPGDGAAGLAPRPEVLTAGWPAFQQPASGYLGIRYIALTRGVGALEPSVSGTTGGRDSSNGTPRTQRDMLNELLPSSQRAINPRS